MLILSHFRYSFSKLRFRRRNNGGTFYGNSGCRDFIDDLSKETLMD